MLEFKRRKKTSKHRSTKWRKYPRRQLERICKTNDKSNKILGYFKNNWFDDNELSLFWGAFRYLDRYLDKNIGNHVDKVYSEFLNKCHKSVSKVEANREFFKRFDKEEDIDDWGGFYLSDGIIKYKEPTKFIRKIEIKSEPSITHNDILKACIKSEKHSKPVFLAEVEVSKVQKYVHKYIDGYVRSVKHSINDTLPKKLPVFIVNVEKFDYTCKKYGRCVFDSGIYKDCSGFSLSSLENDCLVKKISSNDYYINEKNSFICIVKL